MTPVEFRRHLHRHPELSFREWATARFIADALTAEGIAWRPVADTGILAVIEGRRPSPRAVVLRADIDALPVEERTGLEYASENQGVMHACGHDVHAAVLFGVLQRLARGRDFEGTVLGLFQPGEECNPGGASKVLSERPFDGYRIAAVVGEHVEPTLEVGCAGFRAGQYMAASDELRFHIAGRGGHAALRRTTADTVRAAARMVVAATDLNTADRIVSIGRVEAPGATNVIPDRVELEGTMRTYSEELRRATYDELRRLSERIAAEERVHIGVDISRGYPSVVNDPGLAALAEETARETGFRTVRLDLRPTAEDFGFYTQCYPSLLYRLGVGLSAGSLHTAGFSPDERAIDAGVELMRRIALKILRSCLNL